MFAVIQVDTAGWLQMQSTPGIMQSRKSLLQAHIIALVLDAEEVYMYVTYILRFGQCHTTMI